MREQNFIVSEDGLPDWMKVAALLAALIGAAVGANVAAILATVGGWP